MEATTFRMNYRGICPVNYMPTLGWVAAWGQAGARPPPKPVGAFRADPSETQWLNSIYTNIEALTRKKGCHTAWDISKNEFPCMEATTFRMNYRGICPVNYMPTLGWVAAWGQVGARPPPKPVRAFRADPSEIQWLNSIYSNIEALTRKKGCHTAWDISKNEFPCMEATTFRMNYRGIWPVNYMPTLGWVAAWGQAGARPPPIPVRAFRADPSEIQWLNSIYSNIEALTRKKVATLHETFQKWVPMCGSHNIQNELQRDLSS